MRGTEPDRTLARLRRAFLVRGVSVYQHVYFGTVIRYLTHAEAGRPLQGNGLILNQLDLLFEYFEALDLPVTAAAAVDLDLFRNQLSNVTDRSELTAEEARRQMEIRTLAEFDVRCPIQKADTEADAEGG